MVRIVENKGGWTHERDRPAISSRQPKGFSGIVRRIFAVVAIGFDRRVWEEIPAV
jgi:hypothetical protein